MSSQNNFGVNMHTKRGKCMNKPNLPKPVCKVSLSCIMLPVNLENFILLASTFTDASVTSRSHAFVCLCLLAKVTFFYYMFMFLYVKVEKVREKVKNILTISY